jgi:hypothetical protein
MECTDYRDRCAGVKQRRAELFDELFALRDEALHSKQMRTD